MALTSDQLTDLQADLGITDDETVFTDTELERLFTRASEGYNTAVYLGWRQLMADAAKLYKYTVAQTSINKDQVFDHVKAMVEFWATESRTNSNQVAILGVNPIPNIWKDVPGEDYTCRNGQWVKVRCDR